MTYRKISMDDFPRREHFTYFQSLANPYVGLTADVDITALYSFCKAGNYPFFLTLLHRAMDAVNRVKELRYRILDGGIIELEYSPASCTVLLPDETYVYCTLDCRLPLEAYLPQANAIMELAVKQGSLKDAEDALGLTFVSSVPWITYTALIQPTPSPADSNPRISWGKYHIEGERVLLPVTILAHHALVDGIHIGKFYAALEKAVLELPRV